MEYTLQSNLPLAGVGRTLTAKEWKRIYGYDVQNPTGGAEFLPQSSIEKYLNVHPGRRRSILKILSAWPRSMVPTFWKEFAL